MIGDCELNDETNQRLLLELCEVIDQLAAIGRDFEQATTDDGKQQNALAYLHAFVAYLEHLRVGRVLDGETLMPALAVPQTLVADIENIRKRRRTVFLERPKGKTGRPPEPLQHEVALAWASAAIDYLVEEESRGEPAAAGHVMRTIKHQKLALHRASSNSLLNFRADIRSGRRDPEIKNQYHEAREIIWKVAASKGFDAALKHVLYVIGRVCGKKQTLPKEVKKCRKTRFLTLSSQPSSRHSLTRRCL